MTIAAPTNIAKPASRTRTTGALWRDFAALALIFALNWICYVRVINGYFLADDFLHVAYLKGIFAGDIGSLLKNFYGNWMQAEGTTFYRPLISITLAADYLLYGANASGFHLSNLLFQIACSLLIYFVVKEIYRLFYIQREDEGNTGFWAALAAAALFSVNPLHCEVVAWIISRVDSVACVFYLAALALVLWSNRLTKSASTKKWTFISSLIMFICSLCSKEMAVTLPPTLTLLYWLTDNDSVGFRTRFFAGVKKSLPFWFVLTGYLLLRTLALGTISGGYQGSVGEGLSNSLAKRWLYDGAFFRLLFPLNIDVFGHGHGLFKELKLLYILAGVNFALALLAARRCGPALRSLIFGLGWLVISLIPTYQVWNLSETLQGSRFAYFATVPLAFLLALVLLPPLTAKKPWLDRFFLPLRLVLLTFFIVAFATITSKDNGPWQHAMLELKTFQESLCQAAEAEPGVKIAILNIPQSYRGAHMIYNGATMSVMFSPPLAPEDITDHIYTFEPATYGDADLISVSRLRRMVREGKSTSSTTEKSPFVFYAWDRAALKLKPIDFVLLPDKAPFTSGALLLSPNSLALSPELNLSALNVDEIKIKFAEASLKKLQSSADGKSAALALVFAGGELTLPVLKSVENNILTFDLSEHKIWLKQGVVKGLSLKTIACAETIQIESISVINMDGQLPSLSPDNRDLVEGPDGICRVHGPHPTFKYDLSTVPGANGALCEISKPNSWFEHYSGTLRDRKVAPQALYTTTLSKLSGKDVPLSFAGIRDHGFYQIKVAAIDKDGKVINYFSDPLNFQI